MDFLDPRTLSAAPAALADRGPELTLLAGGTDVMVQYLRGDISPAGLLHVRGIPELNGIEANGRTVIGAATTYWQLMSDERMRVRHPALVESAATVGGRQTQNVGTVAGNVVNASP